MVSTEVGTPANMIANYHPQFWQFVSALTADEANDRPISGDMRIHGDPILVSAALRALNRSFNGRYYYVYQDWMTGEAISGRIVDSWPRWMPDEASE